MSLGERTPEQVILSTLVGSDHIDDRLWGLATAQLVAELERAGYRIVPTARNQPSVNRAGSGLYQAKETQ